MEKITKQDKKFAEMWGDGYEIWWFCFEKQNRLFGVPGFIDAGQMISSNLSKILEIIKIISHQRFKISQNTLQNSLYKISNTP